MKSSLAPVVILATSMLLPALASNVAAQAAPVVDLTYSAPKSPVQATVQPADGSYNQSQMMQNEVRELLGLVEQLSYELQRVKKRQMDDYLDLDRRLSALLSGATPDDFAVDADSDLQLSVDGQSPAVVAGAPDAGSDGEQSLDVPVDKQSQVSLVAPAVNTEEIALITPPAPIQLTPITGSAKSTYFKDRMKWPARPSP